MNELYNQLLSLREKVILEGVDREKIKMSDEYMQLEREVQQIQSTMQLMVSIVPDSSAELALAQDRLFNAMNEANISVYDRARLTFREKNRVNVGRVLEVVGGDIVTFLEMTNVTQKTLADYAKLMPELKKDLMACVELESREVTGLTISDPEL